MRSKHATAEKSPAPTSTKTACPGEKRTESTPRPLRSGKIQDKHLEGLAVVYVRQSSPQQVLDHQESRARQYALADHAVALGWPKDRVLVIDEDQGQSDRSADQRDGFKRLLAEVTLGHVGLVLGLEMSRLPAIKRIKESAHLIAVPDISSLKLR